MAVRQLRVAAYSTFVWVVIFDAIHVYWELGGRFGFGDQTDPLPNGDSAVQRIVGWAVLVMFVLGTALPLALVERWGRRIPRWPMLTMAWLAAGLLTARAVAAFIDDAMRTLFGSATGLTGLTYEQVLGTADPSAHTLWSARAIDVYFLVGGVLYATTAWFAKRRPPVSNQWSWAAAENRHGMTAVSTDSSTTMVNTLPKLVQLTTVNADASRLPVTMP
jgi:hypothetical protein